LRGELERDCSSFFHLEPPRLVVAEIASVTANVAAAPREIRLERFFYSRLETKHRWRVSTFKGDL